MKESTKKSINTSNWSAKAGFIQTGQNKIPWHFPDFLLTPLQISLTKLYSSEKLDLIQTYVYSYSEYLCFQFKVINFNFGNNYSTLKACL